MKYGAQLYSLREQGKDEAGIREIFRRCKEMGYQVVQVSGLANIDPYIMRDISQEYSLPIPITHVGLPRLENELDQVIAEHKIFGCPVIGLGACPKPLRDGIAKTWEGFIASMAPIVSKIRDAGLKFAYHNHNFEFDTLDNGRCMFDYLAEDLDWDVIADVCWITVGGREVATELSRLEGKLLNAHLKDIHAPFENRDFCPLGEGVVDLETSLECLKKLNCEFAYVEQDNATKKEDPFDEMARSAAFLKAHGCL